jgi:hypothetical protein
MGLVPAEKAGGNELTLRGRTLQRWLQKTTLYPEPTAGYQKVAADAALFRSEI